MSDEFSFEIPAHIRERMEKRLHRLHVLEEPACWFWPVPSASPPDDSRDAHYFLLDWHDDRCAICDGRRQHLVEDHDHDTGLTRGWLCRSCNTGEGLNDSLLYVRYGERHPAAILGISLEYTGRGAGRNMGRKAQARRVDAWLDVPPPS